MSAAGGPSKSPTDGAVPRAKPPVRNLAQSLGIDLASVAPGSGPNGIITRDDVLRAALPPTSSTSTPVPSMLVPTPVEEHPSHGGTDDEFISVIGIRARIAEHMATAHTKIPDASCAIDIDFTHLLAARDRLVDGVGADHKGAITPFSLVCSLVVQVLLEHPELNATYLDVGPAIRRHAAVHLGIATATPRGLLVPVIHHSERLSPVALADRLHQIANAARSGSIAPQDLVGSTFTISNFGGLGIDDGIPIINYPEAGILGIGSIRERPVVIDGTIVAKPTGHLTLVIDHRVIDGAEAATFLRRLAALIEDPPPTLEP
jgi:pyruvate dehydrogenase E2 component (dihydrolipoamide acetyltransferase)